MKVSERETYTELEKMRHSCSHVLAQAVKRLYPEAQLGFGPPVENGFYYDIRLDKPLVDEDLKRIEEEMLKIIKEDYPFEKKMVSGEEALAIFKKKNEKYKVEFIKELTAKEDLSIVIDGDFTDLCKYPHAESTGKIKVFKLMSVAGAYWRGNETGDVMQRVYGAAFFSDKDLRQYLKNLEEAKKRDHRKLGPELGLFSFNDKVGAGLVLYHPKGAMLRMLVEDYIRRKHIESGYEFVAGPSIMKSDIWVQSGHYENYKENMYIFQAENNEFAVKPMNCPGHIMIYQSTIRSYRDLPIRFFELGSVCRFEKSGVLHGLLRVRNFTQDDAHIFCREDQLEAEIIRVLDFMLIVLKDFGFEDLEIELSTRPEKFIGTENDWQLAEKALQGALDKKALSYEINEGDGAFYGPKIDVKLRDAIGRSWQCATVQCDFALPERFKLKYTDQDGKERCPIMLHRAILGSLERFIGTLIEHYAGKFPLWLAPVQCVLVPITERHVEYAEETAGELQASGVRVKIDVRGERMQKKIKEAQLECIPLILVVGDKEAETKTVSVRYAYGAKKGQTDNNCTIPGLTEMITNAVNKQEPA